ncbi:MAG: hypothetical protein NTX82_02300 [Candidatus Parcubacteria bacterium]|nr:hypothetical protein [Candidatus Parcubacteria bacterium]
MPRGLAVAKTSGIPLCGTNFYYMALEQNQGTPRKKRSLLWILLILLLLIAAILIYLYLFYFKPGPVTENVNINQNTNQAVLPIAPATTSFNNTNASVLMDIEATTGGNQANNQNEQNNAILIATSFTERFGSYSNQSDYRNFQELDQFMTTTVKEWVSQYVAGLKKDHADTNVYYAIETKAISTQVNSFDDVAGFAQILIKTQRQEFNNTITNPSISYQDMLLELVRENNQWKVRGAYWQ